MKKLWIFLCLFIILTSCSFWKSKTWESYSREICQNLWYSKWDFKIVNEEDYKIELKTKRIVSCYKYETDKEPEKQFIFSDFSYYDNAKKLCDSNWYDIVSWIKRNINQENWEIMSQTVECTNKNWDVFETHFSNQDQKSKVQF